ncbi:histidine ammonia-lyase isoform X2 [Poeciliopsis prolifica]|uniref:histidine ammonia-lyase isoform X2 n=1 Tax=Poeciliopsis prolifica TaxID=188132 RepID=UPI0024139CB9|nr:histidine ammonia-lyase isoform X2 [Poeciliopsis prolifica]
MPRFTVHIRDEWVAVACRDTSNNIRWLGQEALKRYIKNKPDNGGIESVKETRFLVRRCQGLGLLDTDDTIDDVLEDNDFVELAIEGDTMSSDFIPCEPGVSNITAAYKEPAEYINLDGNSLTSTDLVNLGRGLYKIKLTPEAERKVVQSRELLDTIVKENRVVYGITTGFGKFARTVIPVGKLKELQENLVRSHSAGLGNPLSPERTRMLLALRINVLAKGHSGISLETLQAMIQAFNASCLSFVPEKGTVGASGDLAPLSHLALGLMGEGKMWSPKSGWADAKYVLEAHGLKPISLKPKEGIALINGTQMITSLGAEAVDRARAIAQQADIVAALTLEVLKGTTKAFDSDIHSLRPHPGQTEVALRFRSLLDSDHHPSEIAESHRFCDRVQDAYTMRCCPQVHGIANDTIMFVQNIINTEINSATDNPMVFAERGETISGGNFHGEYPAKALDFLSIAVHELASISERRIERLCNPSLSELPAFLVNEGGLNSGFMIAHCTAASLVLAIELLAACQGIEFLRPLRTTTPLEKVYDLVRTVVKPWIKDRFMSPDIEAVHRLLLDQKVWKVAKPYIDKYQTEYIPESRPSSPTAFSLDPPASPRKRARHE